MLCNHRGREGVSKMLMHMIMGLGEAVGLVMTEANKFFYNVK